MLKRFSILLIISLAIALVGSVLAGEETKTITLEGKVVCALCTLKKEGMKECQNVLQVEPGEEGGEPAFYYIAKNDVGDELGTVCKGPKHAKITGTVAEKEGKKWITASKIEPLEKS
jgi:hypothetical protein